MWHFPFQCHEIFGATSCELSAGRGSVVVSMTSRQEVFYTAGLPTGVWFLLNSTHFARSIFLVVTACSILAGMDSLAKVLMSELSPLQVTWARFTFHALILAVIFSLQGDRGFLRTSAPKMQWLRGLCLVVVNGCLYFAIQTVSLAEATAVMYLSPVLVTLLAGVWLGERITPKHLLAVFTGFVGVLLIVRPGFQAFDPAMLLVLLAAVMLAVYFLLTRKVAAFDSAKTSLFYTSIVGAAVLSAAVPIFWTAPDGNQWFLLVCMGGLGATGHFLLIKAYTLMPAAELSPWLNSQVVAATLFSVFLFHDMLGWNFFLGTALIVGAGVWLWLSGRAARNRRAAQESRVASHPS